MTFLSFGLLTAMQFFKSQDHTRATQDAESAHLLSNRNIGEESSRRQLIVVFFVVFLLHAGAIAYLHRSPAPETSAKPLVMDVALIAAPPSPQVKPTPPAPPVVQPKPKPPLEKPKKAPPRPKKTSVEKKPIATSRSTTEAAPAAKTVTAPSSAPVNPAEPVAAPPRPAQTPVSPVQPKTETFTEANYRANYKSNPKPAYPRIAKSRGWQGRVLLRVQVTAAGRSASVQVQQSSGHEILDEAAVEAVKNWTFIPAKRGTTPVASSVTVPIQFKLN